jgi:glycosyltransferase involved in cell wall biosynthesis
VLFVSGAYPSAESPVGGIFVKEQAQLLSDRYDVAVLVPAAVGLGQLVRGPRTRLSSLEARDGLAVCRQRAISWVPRSAASAQRALLEASIRGFEALRQEWGSPDIIHAHFVLPAGWAAVMTGRRYSIPVVLTEHSSPFSANLGTARNRRMVRQALEGVEHVIAVGPGLIEEMSAVTTDFRWSVVGNVIRTRSFTPDLEARPRRLGGVRFLSVGMMTAQKGFGDLIEAVGRLVAAGVEDFSIRVGGDGPLRASLEEAVRARGLNRWIEFPGLLDRGQVEREMRECDVFVLASLHESFGIVQAEAMACGKPVIATRNGGSEFVVDAETGVLVNQSDPGALARAMEDFIAGRITFDPVRVRERVVERFGEDAFLENVTRVYEQVLGL